MAKKVTLHVVVKLDPVPGWGQKAQDFVDALKAGHGFPHYIESIVVLDEPKPQSVLGDREIMEAL
jgi:hypothetical protein